MQALSKSVTPLIRFVRRGKANIVPQLYLRENNNLLQNLRNYRDRYIHTLRFSQSSTRALLDSEVFLFQLPAALKSGESSTLNLFRCGVLWLGCPSMKLLAIDF